MLPLAILVIIFCGNASYCYNNMKNKQNYGVVSFATKKKQSPYVFVLLSWAAFILKSDSHFPNVCFICFDGSLLKMMKNSFYFILKTLFILKIFIFLF